MDLWIRSQDRERLIKVAYLELEKDDYGFYILGREDKFSGNRLGIYKTKERALEVLDEIQNILKPKLLITSEGRDIYGTDGNIYKTNVVSNVKTDIQDLSTYVYEMPEV